MRICPKNPLPESVAMPSRKTDLSESPWNPAESTTRHPSLLYVFRSVREIAGEYCRCRRSHDILLVFGVRHALLPLCFSALALKSSAFGSLLAATRLRERGSKACRSPHKNRYKPERQTHTPHPGIGIKSPPQLLVSRRIVRRSDGPYRVAGYRASRFLRCPEFGRGFLRPTAGVRRASCWGHDG